MVIQMHITNRSRLEPRSRPVSCDIPAEIMGAVSDKEVPAPPIRPIMKDKSINLAQIDVEDFSPRIAALNRKYGIFLT